MIAIIMVVTNAAIPGKNLSMRFTSDPMERPRRKKKIAYISDECKKRNTEKVEKDDGQQNHVDNTCTGSTTFTSSSVEINTTNVTKDEGPRGIGPPLLRSVQCVDYGFLRGTNMNNAIEEDAYNGGNGDESLDQDGKCDIKLENTNPKEKHKDGPKDMKEKRKDKDGLEHVKSKEMHEDKRNPDQENQSTEDQTTEQTFFGVMIEPDLFYGQKLVTNKDRRKLEMVKFNRLENWLSGCSISDTSSELNVSS